MPNGTNLFKQPIDRKIEKKNIVNMSEQYTRNTLKVYPTNHSSSVNRISLKNLFVIFMENTFLYNVCVPMKRSVYSLFTQWGEKKNEMEQKHRPRNDSDHFAKQTTNRIGFFFSLLVRPWRRLENRVSPHIKLNKVIFILHDFEQKPISYLFARSLARHSCL